MTREFDFLLAAVRRFFQPESVLPSKEGLDWNLVLQLAGRHAVTGFLQRVCNSPELAGAGLEATHANLALSAELAKLAGVFAREGIEIIPLKGPVLAAALYGDEVLKKSTDLDLLVRRRDALKAKRLLESIGYRLLTVAHWPSDAAWLRNVNDELAFRDPGSWLKLDLHWSLLPGYFPSPLSEVELWAGARSTVWGGARVRSLSPEQQLLFLCAHGTKHLWVRLGWLCDLARLVQVERDMNWSEVFEQARQSHTTRMILLGLLLARDLFGVELPAGAAALAKADPAAQVLAANVVERLRAGRPATHVAVARFCLRVLERGSQRARLVFGMFPQPTEAEYQVLQLPPALYWAYYLLRPLRLTVKHARQIIAPRDRRSLHAKEI